MKIVYIEDDADTRNLVKRVLRPPQFEVDTAETGLAGLKKVEELQPDIVLMDLDLPDIDGLALSTKIKSSSGTKNTIIVAVTGKKEFSNEEKMVIAGCDFYIPKPFNIEVLKEQILEFAKSSSEESRKSAISEFQIDLVNKLEEKVKALESLNKQLGESNKLLAKREKDVSYQNEKLIQLHEISNQIHSMKSLDEFIHAIPEMITSKLGFDRCILFQFDVQEGKVFPAAWGGFAEKEIENIKFQYDSESTEILFDMQSTSLLSILADDDIEGKEKIPYIGDIKRNLHVRKFLMGYIGPTKGKKILEPGAEEDINQPLEELLSSIYEKLDPESLHDELEKCLTSNLYKFTGFLYVDNAITDKPISDFDNKILATLLESAKAVYENLSLIQILQNLYFKAGQDAITDSLTGISNYRYFINQFIRELNRAQRYRIPLSIAMIDIDFFKVYNDSFGHLSGDYVLKQVAQLLKENTRISDIVARYGGEEFVIILPEATKDEAYKLAEKIRAIIADYNFINQENMPDGNLTISCGVASYPDDGHLPEVLIENADIALYEAKRTGRNRVCKYKKGEVSSSDI